jgi:hypothetical protein
MHLAYAFARYRNNRAKMLLAKRTARVYQAASLRGDGGSVGVRGQFAKRLTERRRDMKCKGK